MKASRAPARRGARPSFRRTLPPTGRRPLLLGGAVVAVVAAVVVVVVLVSGSGSSRPLLESFFQDDQYLIYSPPATVAATLRTLKQLGVDRLRLTIEWKAIAPEATSRTPPAGFDATNPAAYPPAAWGPYDTVARLARAEGIGVDFDITAPGPLWAMGQGAPDAKSADHFEPSSSAFGQFVTALGTRYSGRWREPASLGGSSAPLPRVSFWSIWNEPNQPGWLSPQWQSTDGQRVMASAELYRQLADAAFSALERTGHGPSRDTILIGELAPEGSESSRTQSPVPPMPFLRAVYCVDGSYRPLSGATAAALGCQNAHDTSTFVSQNPGLFEANGFAHHPYSFFLAPGIQMADQNFVPLSDLPRLEHGLDAIFSTYGVDRQLPLWLTEYGYETNPPNPFRGVSPRLQSLYLNEAQYMAAQDPRVRALSQFLLYDSPPDSKYRVGSIRYWSTFQTGLLYADGRAKPSLNSYRLPIYIPRPVFAPGSQVLIWGMLRLAANGTEQHAQIQWEPSHGAFRAIATITTDDPSGFLTAHLALPGTGKVRIAWSASSGQVFVSRSVGVTSSG